MNTEKVKKLIAKIERFRNIKLNYQVKLSELFQKRTVDLFNEIRADFEESHRIMLERDYDWHVAHCKENGFFNVYDSAEEYEKSKAEIWEENLKASLMNHYKMIAFYKERIPKLAKIISKTEIQLHYGTI